MHSIYHPVLLCTLLAASPLAAQRMGRVNRDAPTAGCFIEFPGGNRIEVSYRAITLAEGKFMDRLESFRKDEDREKVEGYIERFNTTASRQPLGRLKVTGNLELGGRKIPAGDYGLAFMLTKKVDWKLVVLDEDQKERVSWMLATKAPEKKARRLAMWLVAGDKEAASLGMAFGDVSSKLAVAVVQEEREVRGASGRRRR